MFGTLLYDKNNRKKFVIKECFNGSDEGYGWTKPIPSLSALRKGYTSSYNDFIKNFKQSRFNPYTLSSNLETYQPVDYDNNVASIYGYRSDGYDTTPKSTVLTCTENDGLMGMNRWCGCEALSANGTTETATRRLIGGVNPRTLIEPRMVPPITDMEEWGTDNYTIHSATNNSRSDELFLSGYAILDDCKCKGVCNCDTLRPRHKPLIKENFNHMDHAPAHQVCHDTGRINIVSPYDVSAFASEARPQILQNYGISTTPEKSNYTSITNGEDLIFVENRQKQKHLIQDYITADEPSMIYDPRMIGYSDSNRGYVDKLLGQPKFYYDDINAARAPNYITRNKIDIYSFGETTGRLKDPNDVQTCGNNNQLAVEEFHNSALQHRADIMHSLMNKRNKEMWQLRNFPISTNGQRMLGGTSKI